MPGMISRVLFNEEIGCTEPSECLRFCGSSKGCSNVAYPKLIIDMMPDGARGIMVAVMMAGKCLKKMRIGFNSAVKVLFILDFKYHLK